MITSTRTKTKQCPTCKTTFEGLRNKQFCNKCLRRANYERDHGTPEERMKYREVRKSIR